MRPQLPAGEATGIGVAVSVTADGERVVVAAELFTGICGPAVQVRATAVYGLLVYDT